MKLGYAKDFHPQHLTVSLQLAVCPLIGGLYGLFRAWWRRSRGTGWACTGCVLGVYQALYFA